MIMIIRAHDASMYSALWLSSFNNDEPVSLGGEFLTYARNMKPISRDFNPYHLLLMLLLLLM